MAKQAQPISRSLVRAVAEPTLSLLEARAVETGQGPIMQARGMALRRKADALRTLADGFTYPRTKRLLRALASDYDQMAKLEEDIAVKTKDLSSIVEFNGGSVTEIAS